MGDLQLIGKGRLADVFAWGDTQVLKLFAAGRDAAAVDEEARVSQILHDAGVATPGTHGVIEVDGRRGIIYDRAPGTTMLGQLSAKPWRIFAFGHMLAELHASVHQCRADRLPSLHKQFECLIARAELPADQRDAALSRLRALPEGNAVCHGDFHPDNVLVNGDSATIIDWTTACTGNPVADFARTLLILQLGAPLSGVSLWTRMTIHAGRALFSRTYGNRYRKICSVSPREVREWMLPVAVARLGHDVTAERDQLVAYITRVAT
jgi:aminoglycoside phosphotransferase (APT) family kinase protein